MLHGSNKSPPFYGSYALFERALSYWKKNGTPKLFTSTGIKSAVGNDASRVISGFGGIGWIDRDGFPSREFKALVEAYGEEAWCSALRTALEKAYAFVPSPWSDLTSSSLREAFKTFIGRESSVIANAETFFLIAAVEAKIELPETFANRVSRSKPRIQVKEGRRFFEPSQHVSNGNGFDLPLKSEIRPPVDVLFSLFDEACMSEKEKAALVTLAFHLQKHGGKSA